MLHPDRALHRNPVDTQSGAGLALRSLEVEELIVLCWGLLFEGGAGPAQLARELGNAA
jgi:hypothetical protein